MTTNRVDLVQGWTEAVSFTLMADGAVIDLTGRTVTIHARDKSGVDPSFLGAVAVTSASSGRISFTPDSTDLLESESPYTVRFKVMSDGYFVPNGDPVVFVVRND